MTEQGAAIASGGDPIRRLLRPEEVAELVGVPVRSLHQQRYKGVGVGALAIRVGKHLRWRPEDLERWLDEQGQG